MLLSPGNSPRHLSVSATREKSDTVVSSSSLETLANPRKAPTILDEDTYVGVIEEIIERDFFPDLPKLRDRLDWLEAVRSNDPLLIRDVQLKILDRRNGGKRTIPTGSDGKGRLSSSSFSLMSPTPFDSDKSIDSPSRAHEVMEESCSGGVNESLSLDQFFRRYTSEDNDSFSKIMEKVNRKRKERYGHLWEGENNEQKFLELEKRDRITDGYGTSDQPVSTLDGWKFTAKNLLMYETTEHEEPSLTEAEKEVRIKSLTKEINRKNTRFHGALNDSRPKEEDTVAILYSPVAGTSPAIWPFPDREAERTKKYDLEELRKTPNPFYVESGKKSENGYSFVRTPSPAPGVDESPFMTWGEIEGTPLRLEEEDTPVGIGGSGEGAHFKIPLPPSRDLKAHSLSREAARKLRERSKMYQKPPLPSPIRGGSASPSVRSLSPAAQKFVRNAIAKSTSSVDESLRASYRGASPGFVTSKNGRSMTRFARDGSLGSRSPSIREGPNPPW